MITNPIVLQLLQIGLGLLSGWLIRHNFGTSSTPSSSVPTASNPLLDGLAGRIQDRLSQLEAELIDSLVAPTKSSTTK